MKLNRLYKRSTTGAVLFWDIEVDTNKHRTHSGQIDGVTTTTEWTICLPKNEGKLNATTADQQALKDAQSKWKKKLDREQFVETFDNLDVVKFVQPMLAQKFEDRVNELNFNDGVWVQCKLNGARCVATKDGLYSRKGSVWQSVPHIGDALKPFFENHPNVVLDGELFNNELRQDLGSIISLVSKKKITAIDLDKSKQIVQYHIYDTVDTTKKYKQRIFDVLGYIEEINSPYIKSVESQPVMSVGDIDFLLEEYEKQGHEGAIVRTNGVYENKRSKHLLKYKTFIDDEFEIVDVIEGEGNLTGKVGKFELIDSRGEKFRASPVGSHEYWERMWQDRASLKGKIATVKFKELTPIKDKKGGVPSFAKLIAIRNYE
jgi:DNA ligase-1